MLDLTDKAEQDDEQAVLDEHNNKIADATAHIQQLLAETPKPEPLSSDSDLELKDNCMNDWTGLSRSCTQ